MKGLEGEADANKDGNITAGRVAGRRARDGGAPGDEGKPASKTQQ
jgi:hypothetical protein